MRKEQPVSLLLGARIARLARVAELLFFTTAILLSLESSRVIAATTAPAAPKRVLLLHSFGREFAPFNVFSGQFRTDLAKRSPNPIDFYDVSLESARFGDPQDDGPFLDYIRALFANRELDLVVPLGGPAVRFVQRNRAALFPHTSVLLAAVDDRHLRNSDLTDRDAAVPVHFDLPAVMENILRVLPETKSVYVVMGNSPLEKFWTAQTQQEFAPFAGRVQFTWLDELSFDALRKRLASLPPHSAIFYGQYSVDAGGVPHEEDQALSDLHAIANAPMFGVEDYQLGRGIVGGPMMNVAELSRASADIATRLLAGEAPANLRTAARPFGTPAFDARELIRWQIDEANLPSGSIVQFRQPSFWHTYKWQLSAAVGICAAEMVLILFLLLQHGKRRRAEQSLTESETRLRQLSGRLIKAQEDERARLARELHDDVTQRLARLAIDVGRMEQSAISGTSRISATETLRQVREGLVRLSEDVHSVAYQLHPSVLEDLGLADAIRTECEHFSRRESIPAEVTVHTLPDSLPRPAAMCLFRVTQEALHNVVRHARAQAVRISLSQMEHGLRLAVHDDGVGFDPDLHRSRPSLGLASMLERTRLIGGELDIDSAPGRGTTVVAWVPLTKQEASS